MKHLLLLALMACPGLGIAQPLVSTWSLNTDGRVASQWFNNGGMPPTYTYRIMTDSADAVRVAYTDSSVYIHCQGLTTDMGQWLNPGGAVAQNYTFRFPRNPRMQTGTHTLSPQLGHIGLLTNGVPIYGLSNANSWTGTTNAAPRAGGQQIWNVEVGKSEGFVLDTALGAHPQQQGAYHTHTTPYRLYKNTPTGKHSPLVGYAFDGFPVYGPYGYESPLDSTSAAVRMKTGYSLRNITTRTNLPSGATASQTGPAVSTTYPLGTYTEDYEWLASNGGDLDEHNGRLCVTPDYPNGVYAYFVTIDAAGKAAFPYYIGITYYGIADVGNFPTRPGAGNGITIPGDAIPRTDQPTTGIAALAGGAYLRVYPNPAAGRFTVAGTGQGVTHIQICNMLGQTVYEAKLDNTPAHAVTLPVPGLYLIKARGSDGRMRVQPVMVRP